MEEQHHVALPKLYGAPAYARPPRPVDVQDRPFDPDDLPLEAFRDLDEDGHGGVAVAVATASGDAAVILIPSSQVGGEAIGPGTTTGLEARAFSLKGLARRISGR